MDFYNMTALELGRQIQAGRCKVRDLVEGLLERIQRQEREINAYISLAEPQELLARAEEIQANINSGKLQGPLAGVPVAVKDNICTRKLPTTCGSKILQGFVSPYAAHVVDRMEEAGMLVVGKTNMDEFAMGNRSDSSAFGPVRNPLDQSRVAGGSSGGSAAALAAGEAWISLGSDTGGSIRQPAAFCGLVGLKPTYGRVSRQGLVAYGSSLDQIGPIGKDVADCAALLEIIAGRDPMDSTSLEAGDLDLQGTLVRDVRGMKIGIPRDYFSQGLDPQVKKAVLKAANRLAEAGALVEDFDLGLVDYGVPTYYIIAMAEASSNLERFDGVKYGYRAKSYEDLHQMYKKTRAEAFGTEVKRRIMMGSFVLSSGYYQAYYLKAQKVRRLIKNALDKAFETYDLILGPTAPTTAPRLGEKSEDPLESYMGDVYTISANLAGIPAISLPCGRDREGMPVGLQLMANALEEKKLIQAAYTYEQVAREEVD
ncbi:MAG: Asp-tRNA(Asn)/Glu-tRNA(Gln) amidotransferase subunit GatA [Eubacterium sp.]|nr:Asp-tRNA(Asn)/Glu-tRNA(Gln) amidotransferase subunit GatA [Eubacterium sp.]